MSKKINWLISPYEYYADFVVIPIFIFASVIFNSFSIVLLLLVLTIWTIIEYIMHRFVFHRKFRKEHWQHHINAEEYIGVSTIKTSAIFFILLIGALFTNLGSLYTGIALGYLLYIVIHDAMHHENFITKFIPNLRKNHEEHHKFGKEVNFGVITSFWDRIFKTYE